MFDAVRVMFVTQVCYPCGASWQDGSGDNGFGVAGHVLNAFRRCACHYADDVAGFLVRLPPADADAPRRPGARTQQGAVAFALIGSVVGAHHSSLPHSSGAESAYMDVQPIRACPLHGVLQIMRAMETVLSADAPWLACRLGRACSEYVSELRLS